MKKAKPRPRCAHPGCVKIPSFNLPDQVQPLFCSVHKTSSDMVNVVGPQCAYEGGCCKAPSCNFPSEKSALMCKVHALPGMLNVKSARCAHPGCTRISPKYNSPTETRGILCKAHAGPEMIDVLNKKCAHTGCGTRPSYNIPGLRSGLFCLEHKSATMVNVLNKLCDFPMCGTQPIYGAPGQKQATRCAVHKDETMINVVSPLCDFPGCTSVHPSYGVPGQKRGSRCFKHKEPTMVDLLHKGCKHSTDCTRLAAYSEPDQSHGTMCCVHRSPTMISRKNKKCQAAKCKRDAEYGKSEFHRAQFCGTHKPDEYVDVYAERRCDHEGCTADYDLVYDKTDDRGTVEQHKACLAHAPQGYEDTIKRKCKYCDIREDVPFVCLGCRQRMHKKEYAVVRHLRRTIDVPLEATHYDESPALECTRRRPDIRFEMPTHEVIVEVDENQHRGYEESCECARISEIVGAIGGKSVVFVRYNPDVVRYGGTVKTVTAAERIDLLVDTVKSELQNAPSTFSVRLVQLWYDGPVPVPKQEIDITRIVAV